MPACFSRPICTLALYLNDWSSDEERQHLLPFVARLACADTSEIERQREAYIASRIRYRLPFRKVSRSWKARWPLDARLTGLRRRR
jgi:hypothetical protein